jgi:hypothetical protein
MLKVHEINLLYCHTGNSELREHFCSRCALKMTAKSGGLRLNGVNRKTLGTLPLLGILTALE